jgi:hypothetical protein
MNSASSLEERLRESARAFKYPGTPAISRAVRLRLERPAVPRAGTAFRAALLALVILAAAALAMPQVRAQVLKFLRIGVVRIFLAPPSPTAPAPVPTARPANTRMPVTATPRPLYTQQVEPLYSVSMQGLDGETTLETARQRVDFPILLPGEPTDLGQPDHVFLQENGQFIILVWLDHQQPDKVRLSLHEIGSNSVLVSKYQPRVLEQILVNGHDAAWVQGPYIVELTNGDHTWRKLVNGSTLIWEADGVTYRLESDLTLEQALPIAESLR